MFRNSEKFSYSNHEAILNKFNNAKEIYDYILDLNIQDEYFNNIVIPELKKLTEIERFYGNAFNKAKDKLKELTL